MRRQRGKKAALNRPAAAVVDNFIGQALISSLANEPSLSRAPLSRQESPGGHRRRFSSNVPLESERGRSSEKGDAE
jgi:hypothetical protein